MFMTIPFILFSSVVHSLAKGKHSHYTQIVLEEYRRFSRIYFSSLSLSEVQLR